MRTVNAGVVARTTWWSGTVTTLLEVSVEGLCGKCISQLYDVQGEIARSDVEGVEGRESDKLDVIRQREGLATKPSQRPQYQSADEACRCVDGRE